MNADAMEPVSVAVDVSFVIRGSRCDQLLVA